MICGVNLHNFDVIHCDTVLNNLNILLNVTQIYDI